MSYVGKNAQSKRSKRTLNLLEQVIRDQVAANIESMDKKEPKMNKEAKIQMNGNAHQNGFERKSRERTKRSKSGGKVIKSSKDRKKITVIKTNSLKQSRSRSPSSSSSFWSNGKDSRGNSRSRSRSYSQSRSRSSSRSRSDSRSRSYSRSRSRSYSRSRSRSYSRSRSRSYSRSRSRSRSRSASLETPRSKSSEEPSQSTTKSLPVKSVKSKDKDVMSDIVMGSRTKKPPAGHRHGRLLKRRQRKTNVDTDAFIDERLKQKYRELEEIMKGKSVKTNTITRQYIGQMETLREQYHMVSHGLAPPGLILPRSMSQEFRTKGHQEQSSKSQRRPMSGGSYNSELSNKSTDMAYRSMQNVIHYPKHEYLPTKPRRKKSKRKNSESTIDNLSFHSQTTGTTQKTGGSTVNTPRDVDGQEKMNYHIKYSSKEDLRKWLKEKDKLHRKKAKEEKAKKRAEREKMVLEANEKFEKRLEAQKIYKEWADNKNKEIAKQNRRERKENKRILKEYEEQKEKREIRPVSAPLRRRDPSASGGIKVEGTSETNVNLRGNSKKSTNDSTVQATPHPPTSKFIYKRPVAGRIKLAVNGHGPGGQNVNQERPKTASSSRSRSAEGNRMSYDQWVLQKRKQDQKKKELEEKQKQDQMSKSDPDLNKIIPDIAKKRVHNVLEGKKRIDTGVKKIDDKLNKKFGGGDSQVEEHEDSEILRYSYRLESDRTEKSSTSGQINVSGTAIKRPPSGTRRSQTAPVGRVPPPKKSTGSPRQAVVPKLDDVMNEENTSNPFKLPFPSEQGVPKHVASRQRQLFAEQIWERLESDERPEPQGSDVPEPATCIGMGSPPIGDSDDKVQESNVEVNGKLKTETGKTENGMQSENQASDEKLNPSEKEDGGEIFLTQFNSTENLNIIESSKVETTETKVEEKPNVEKLNLNFADNPQRDDVSDSDESPIDRDQKDEDIEEKIESVQTPEETVAEDRANDDGKSEEISEESNDTTNAETNDKEMENSGNVDILNLDLENTTRSSKRVSFNEAPEVFQTEDWSTDTQTPDEENFKSGLDNSSNPYEKDCVTSSLDDDF